jgi:hypothetical protein
MRHTNDIRGQALVETVVWLPVLVLVFLGLFYLKGLVETKAVAIEAARHVSWEHAWWVREATDRQYKTNDQLKQDLKSLGLGEPTVVGQKHKETLSDYVARVSGDDAAEASVEIPAFLMAILGGGGGSEVGGDFTSPPGDSGSTGGADSSSGSIGLPGAANGVINGLLNVVGEGSFIGHGFFARQTAWTEEEDASVITSEVTYRYAAGGAAVFPARDIKQTSSLLSHPFSIKRGGGPHSSDANEEEHFRLVGDGCPNDGHIFGLWLYPSGPIVSGELGSGISTVAGLPKCIFAAIGDLLGAFDSINEIFPFSGGLGYQMPSGTLKEYPELDQPRSSSTSGLGPPSP